MCVELKKSQKSGEDVSPEIVVVHEKGVPKLHGILKQRTVSESSDDGVRTCEHQVSTTTGSEGDDNEDSTDTGRSTASLADGVRPVLRKSVSFNDHIDRTLFQANQSVSSMHAALKNRRRRARKRDQKQEQKEQRRRRRSSGSFSLEESGDEQITSLQAARIHTGKAGENCRADTESAAEVEDRSISSQVSSDKVKVDGSLSHISDGAEVIDEELLSSPDVFASDSSSGYEDVHGNENHTWNTSPKSKLASDETMHEHSGCSDALRTTSCLEVCGSEMISDVRSPTNIGDNTPSVHEKCELSLNFMERSYASGDMKAEGAIAKCVVSGSGSHCLVEPLELSQSANNKSLSVAESESLSFKRAAVPYVSSVLDLDVD